MIYPESKVLISDNSGGRVASCLKVLKGSRRRGAKPGGLLVISLKKVIPKKKLVKGNVHLAVLIRGKKKFQRDTGVSLKFFDNALIVINEKHLPLSNRIYGPIYKELYYERTFSKILSLARLVI